MPEDDIAKIKAVFAAYPQVEQVILYGSRAMGTYKPYSDIDLTMHGSQIDLTLQQEIEIALDDLLLPWKFDLSIYHQISNEGLKDHINRVGKSFYMSGGKV